jgi:predicted NAD-dependent protein-ADP-ribosyltransferase YbiA (DUF1768 family)
LLRTCENDVSLLGVKGPSEKAALLGEFEKAALVKETLQTSGLVVLVEASEKDLLAHEASEGFEENVSNEVEVS